MARLNLRAIEAANESHYYCTGPIAAYISFAPFDQITDIRFLGTCEQYPQVTGDHAWMPIFTNDSGPLVPQDKLYAGKTRTIILDLNNYNSSNLEDAIHTPEGSNSPYPQGTTGRLDRGKFLVSDSPLGCRLWLIYTFYNTANAAAFPDMIPGEFYPACNLVGDYQDRQGTQDKKHRLILEAQEIRDPETGQWQLYSTSIDDMFGLNHRPIS